MGSYFRWRHAGREIVRVFDDLVRAGQDSLCGPSDFPRGAWRGPPPLPNCAAPLHRSLQIEHSLVERTSAQELLPDRTWVVASHRGLVSAWAAAC